VGAGGGELKKNAKTQKENEPHPRRRFRLQCGCRLFHFAK